MEETMLNIVALFGKVVKVFKSGNQYYLILSVEKDFREIDGSVKEELIKCTLWKGIADSINQYYHPGQFLQITGRLENIEEELVVVGEKVNFISRLSRGIFKEE